MSTPFIATTYYAIEYDRYIHRSSQSPEVQAIEQEFAKRLVPLLLQDYLRRKAIAESKSHPKKRP